MIDLVLGTRSFGVGNGNITAAPHTPLTALFEEVRANGDTVIACRTWWPRGTTQYAEIRFTGLGNLHMCTIHLLA